MIEIETIEAFERHLSAGVGFANVIIQGLDLRRYTQELASAKLVGAVFLGCELEKDALKATVEHGAMVFPPISGVPYQPYRGALYTPEELYAGFDPTRPDTYADTLDARIYAHWNSRGGAHTPSILETLAQRLHDHAISDALEEALLVQGKPRRVVAIMGGHSMLRGQEAYRSVAELARSLARLGFFLVSGGGPGAMEATHLGAWFASRPDEDLDAALAVLARAPSYKDRDWLSRAFEVRAMWPLLRQQRARGGPAHHRPGRRRLFTRQRGHRAGDLPGRVPEPLQHRGRHQPHALPGPRVLDEDAARVPAAGAPGPGA